jgi:hypothetical protein
MKLIHSPTDPLVQSQLCMPDTSVYSKYAQPYASLVTCPATRRMCDGNWLLQY